MHDASSWIALQLYVLCVRTIEPFTSGIARTMLRRYSRSSGRTL